MDGNGIPRDDFKWFGEGFDGFPKRLPDDCVEYIILILTTPDRSNVQVRTILSDIQRSANELSKKLLRDYIWQREAFSLELQWEIDRWVLRGRTNYGDSVADEWLIVYLLRELSTTFPEAWIRVFDSDGEFLLIEAANALPRWLNPEIAENRVWLRGGKLLVVPREQARSSTRKTEPISKPLSFEEAVSFLNASPDRLTHSRLIEEEAFYRLRNYPARISDSLHNALITIPRKLAYLIHRDTSYISPAVEAFYVRDPISLRPLQEANASTLRFPPDDLVTISTRFTKVGYAQLKSQEFEPPETWRDVLSKNSNGEASRRIGMGMKVTCSVEMLVADPQTQDTKAVREIKLLLEDVESGEDQLPSDEAISKWSQTDDDEAWLDIDFQDFERELEGKKGTAERKGGAGFGDKSAQEDLRKMVERFEQFLNDDTAGAEGAEFLDDMDYDDEEDSDSTSEGEDEDISFDEQEFGRMMKEMMGLPPESTGMRDAEQNRAVARVEDIDSDEEPDADEIQELSEQMEAELRASGALKLDSAPGEAQTKKPTIKGKERAEDVNLDHDSTDDEVDVDFNLAKNMLESLKAEAGMMGPSGSLLASMGMKFPRDDDGNESK